MNGIADGKKMKLCEIDRAVLAAEKDGKEWRTVRGVRAGGSS